MVINREFFFRGWLPAGLVINARLLTTPVPDGTPILKPVINPEPGRSWDAYQPQPVFPVDQASDTQAIVLVNEFSDGALVMLPLGDWLGTGTPYILATNTWYEGKIQTVSGGDIMAIRIMGNQRRDYFTSSAEASKADGVPDVSVTAMAAYFISGSNSRQAIFVDDGQVSLMYEKGYTTSVVDTGGSPVPARVMDYFSVKQVHVAGLRGAYTKEDPSEELRYIQCEVVNGNTPTVSGKPYNFFGMIPICTWVVQNFYRVNAYMVAGAMQLQNLLDPDSEQTLAVLSQGKVSDQLFFMN